jgi:hypothetical protein
MTQLKFLCINKLIFDYIFLLIFEYNMQNNQHANNSNINKNSNDFGWSKSFSKSISENSQIVFSKKLTVATISQDIGLPYSEILDLQEIKNLENLNNSALVCFCDNRTIFYHSIKKNSLVHVTIFFPLSREKYKINCALFTLSGDGDDISTSQNQNQIQSYFNLNYIYNNKTHGLDKLEADYYIESKNYLHKIKNNINNKKEEKLNAYWNKLNNEEKLFYEVLDKDTIKAREETISSSCDVPVKDDLSKFEAQEEIFYSKHFSVIYLVPLDVEHSIYPMPQVVANSRKPNFESLYKPHKKPKKFLFMLNMNDKSWNFKELYA